MYRRREPETNWEKFLEFYDHNHKKLKHIFIFTGVCIVLLLLSRLTMWTAERYIFNRDLNRTVNQISQLVDNVRTTYAVHTQTKTDIMRLMAQSNIMPDFMVSDGKLLNVYGGGISVVSSSPIVSGEEVFPTFKISYQGLSKEVCMALSSLNWGNAEGGLISEALGYIDENGVDTALRDIEEDVTDELVEVDISEGHKKWVKLPKPMLSNVAKPDDMMNPLPFSQEAAEEGCKCDKERSCSFALRYYTHIRK